MLTCFIDMPKVCIEMLKNFFIVKGCRKLFYCGGEEGSGAE